MKWAPAEVTDFMFATAVGALRRPVSDFLSERSSLPMNPEVCEPGPVASFPQCWDQNCCWLLYTD